VTRDFFNDGTGGIPYAEKHFKRDKYENQITESWKIVIPDYRKLKDYYDNLSRIVLEDIATGNQSMKEGDLSEKYKFVQLLMTESDAAETLKEGKKTEDLQLQEKLASTTDEVRNGKKNNANKNTQQSE